MRFDQNEHITHNLLQIDYHSIHQFMHTAELEHLFRKYMTGVLEKKKAVLDLVIRLDCKRTGSPEPLELEIPNVVVS